MKIVSPVFTQPNSSSSNHVLTPSFTTWDLSSTHCPPPRLSPCPPSPNFWLPPRSSSQLFSRGVRRGPLAFGLPVTTLPGPPASAGCLEHWTYWKCSSTSSRKNLVSSCSSRKSTVPSLFLSPKTCDDTLRALDVETWHQPGRHCHASNAIVHLNSTFLVDQSHRHRRCLVAHGATNFLF